MLISRVVKVFEGLLGLSESLVTMMFVLLSLMCVYVVYLRF